MADSSFIYTDIIFIAKHKLLFFVCVSNPHLAIQHRLLCRSCQVTSSNYTGPEVLLKSHCTHRLPESPNGVVACKTM